MDEQFNKEAFQTGGLIMGSQTTANVTFEKSTKNGSEVRVATGDILNDDKSVKATFLIGFLVNDSKAISVKIGADSTEPGLKASAARIFGSLEIK